MENLKKRIVSFLQKTHNWGLYMMILLLSSLVPLVLIGRYNIMMADDYAMGKFSHYIWENTESMTAVLKYAFTHTFEVWKDWQGCFTINFLDSLNPGFFGESFTWVTPVVMLVAVLVSLFFFVKMFLEKYYECNKKDVLAVYALLAFLVIQTLPAPVEALYWYSGAVAYTFVHFGMLLLFCILWKAEQTKNLYLQQMYGLAAVIYAFLVGGGQYITVLQCLLWYAILLFLDRKKLTWWKISAGVTLVTGFAVNVLAGGNAVRQEEVAGMSPVKAILYSFVEALRYGKEWITPLLILTLCFTAWFAWNIVKVRRIEWKYKNPLWVLAGSYCIFSAAFTPSLYGVANVDSGRIQNLIQSIFYILLFVNLFYATGWLQCKIKDAEEGFFGDLYKIKEILKKYTGVYCCMSFAAILLILAGTGDKNTFSSVSAMRSLVNGEAQKYYAEAMERLEMYQDDTVEIVSVRPFSVQPKVLYFTDVTMEDDANYWINENVAAYYRKEKVILRYADGQEETNE